MKIYISKDYSKLKYYTVLTYAILPFFAAAFLVEFVFSLINSEFDGVFSYVLPLFIITLCILSSVFLAGFSKAGPAFLAVLLLIFSGASLIDIFAGNRTDIILRTADILLALVYIGWGLYNHFYFVARKPLFFSETEEFSFEENEGYFWKKVLKLCLLVFLVWLGYEMMSGLVVGKADELLQIINHSGNLTALQFRTYQRILPNLFMGIGLWAAGIVMAVTSHKSRTADCVLLGISKDKKPLRSLCIGGFIGLVLVALAALVLFIGGTKIISVKLSGDDFQVMLVNLFYLTGVGFTEEMMYRGIIMGYGKKRGTVIAASVISLVGFVALHFINGAYKDIAAAPFLFTLGLSLTLMRIYSDNLWICIGMHSLYDWGINHFISINPMGTGESFWHSNVITVKRMYSGIVISSLIISAVIAVLLLIRYIRKKKPSVS